VDLVGWALAADGPLRVVARRHAVAGDPRERVGRDGLVEVGVGVPHRKRRPDVLARFPTLARGDRSGWKIAVERDRLPADGPCEVFVFAESPRGGSARIGSRVLVVAARPAEAAGASVPPPPPPVFAQPSWGSLA
jgi:hypothetical protein